MQKAARNHAPAAAEPAGTRGNAVRKRKIPLLLVTGDDSLWPQVGADLSNAFALSALDGIDELLSSTPVNTQAIVLWDAREQSEPAQTLSRMQLHSPCFAVVVIDEPRGAGLWTLPLQHRQVVAHVAVPVVGAALAKAIEAAAEEVQARGALLGAPGAPESSAAPAALPPARRRLPLVPLGLAALVLAGAAAWLLTRRGSDPADAAPPHAAAAKTADANQEKLDGLIEKAQQAMAERHFIDPAAGSALSLYRDALLVDPSNGEARQGLERLAAILVARIQSALDERKFDLALQSLETARSINANDARLPAFDEKIAALRAELGPAQIAAAINAQNFDRALQLIDESARARSLPAAKLAQLREDVRRRREDAEQGRLLKLVDTRLQQDRLLEPRTDSAAYYLNQARQAGASPAQLQSPSQELQRRLAQSVRVAIEQRHFSDADLGLADLRELAAPPATLAALQRELTAARSGAAQAVAPTPSAADLVQQRLSQGRLLEPDNDSALYYLNQLRAADPKNGALAPLGAKLQSQLVDQARTALDGGDTGRAEATLQQARSLGVSADLDALAERLRSASAAAAEPPQLTEQSLTRLAKLEITYPTRAQQAGVEGWVEIGYLVKVDGSVANIKILGASPAGAFEQAATKAVSKLRYQPVSRDGKPIAVATQVRVLFRIPK